MVGAKDPDDLEAIRQFAVAYLRHEQDLDLKAFGVGFDVYFLESSLYSDGKVEETVRELVAHGHTYEEGGALWLRSTDFGDDKDRVMRKSDGTYTYFVPDVAYHLSKWQRGYERAITVLGSDHHGSLARVKAGLQALDAAFRKGWPEYVLYQMVTVMKGGEEVKISKRAGSYVTLRDLIDEVGRDATRYFLIARKSDSQLVFDIDLARSQSNDNPVYYIQYAHARVCSVLRQAGEKGFSVDLDRGLQQLARLDNEHEQILLTELSKYPEIVEAAAANLEPHVVAGWLRELANAFHTYYNAHQFLVDDADLRNARLALVGGDAPGTEEWFESAGPRRPGEDVNGSTQGQGPAGRAQPKSGGFPGLGLGGDRHPGRRAADGGADAQVSCCRWRRPARSPIRRPPRSAAATPARWRRAAATSAPKKPQYDFYSLLSEKEVRIPDAVISAQATRRAAEAAGRSSRRWSPRAEAQQRARQAQCTARPPARTSPRHRPAPLPTPGAGSGYLLQVGAFPNAADAESPEGQAGPAGLRGQRADR